ncbi:MAG: Rpn family recombination-promoting nuclease/putative transposase [Planctomycetes bacterium]|nr:Rpn family recombination-promoting nuclease/putative transposase [Planctomycetota bacterium]
MAPEIEFDDFSILQSPHDGYFKWLFTRIACVLSFLVDYLGFGNRRLEVEAVPLDTVLTGDDLKEKRSDVLYKVTFLGFDFYVYVLMEHKSDKNFRTPFQIHDYLNHIYGKLSEGVRKLGDKVSLVIPVVVYHGKKEWDVPTEFSEMILIPPKFRWMKKYAVKFEYEVIDLVRGSFESLKGIFPLRLGFRLLKANNQSEIELAWELTIEEFEEELKKMTEEELSYELRTHMIYSVQAMRMPKKQLLEVITRKFEDKGKQMAKTWLEKAIDRGFDKGFKEGILEGKAEGKAEGRLDVLEKVIRLRFGDKAAQAIEKIRGKSSDEAIDKTLEFLSASKDLREFEKKVDSL